VSLYEEVEADQSAMNQAMVVVVLSSVAVGIGSAKMGIFGIILITIAALIGWYVWAYLIYLIGVKLLPEKQTKADVGQLLRTIGFSSSPGVLRIFAFIPGLGPVISSAAGIWMLVAMIVAVRQALDYENTWRAVGVCMIGWLIQGGFFVILLSATGALEQYKSKEGFDLLNKPQTNLEYNFSTEQEAEPTGEEFKL